MEQYESVKDYDSMYFRQYTLNAETDKALHTLEGILRGIAIDQSINISEIQEVVNWYEKYRDLVYAHPFSELIPVIANAISDGILEQSEMADILWLCNNFRTTRVFYDVVTSDIQKLEGVLHGIISDNVITAEEMLGLKAWLNENEHLAKTYPYDEVYSIALAVMADGVVSEQEQTMLKAFFSEFADIRSSEIINVADIQRVKAEINIHGICSTCPEIVFPNKIFCFTGTSSKTTRQGFANIVTSIGARFVNNVTQETNYLVIGNEGNPCWAFSCYGRKVEQAVNLRKSGLGILIIHEHDFWDALEDYTACNTIRE